MSLIIIILTTSASLRTVDPLLSYLTVKLIIAFEGSVFYYEPTLLLEVIIRF
jgi:hypothetical protein